MSKKVYLARTHTCDFSIGEGMRDFERFQIFGTAGEFCSSNPIVSVRAFGSDVLVVETTEEIYLVQLLGKKLPIKDLSKSTYVACYDHEMQEHPKVGRSWCGTRLKKDGRLDCGITTSIVENVEVLDSNIKVVETLNSIYIIAMT